MAHNVFLMGPDIQRRMGPLDKGKWSGVSVLPQLDDRRSKSYYPKFVARIHPECHVVLAVLKFEAIVGGYDELARYRRREGWET